MLGRCPVQPLALGDALARVSTMRASFEFSVICSGTVVIDRRSAAAVQIDSSVAAAFHPMGCMPDQLPASPPCSAVIRAGLEFRVKIGDAVVNHLLRLFRGHDPLGDQLFGIDGGRSDACRWSCTSAAAEHRLVAHYGQSAGSRRYRGPHRCRRPTKLDDARGMNHGFRIIAIHMEDRGHHHLRHIRRIARSANSAGWW